jgi:hypothetical protein
MTKEPNTMRLSLASSRSDRQKRASKIGSLSRRPRETAMQGVWKFRIEEFPPVRDCMDDRERQGDVIGYFRRLGPICQPSEASPVQRSAPERLGAKKPTVKSPRLATVLGAVISSVSSDVHASFISGSSGTSIIPSSVFHPA